MSKRWTAKSPMSGYLVAIAATLVVLLLRLLLSGLLGDSAYFFPFVIGAALAGLFKFTQQRLQVHRSWRTTLLDCNT